MKHRIHKQQLLLVIPPVIDPFRVQQEAARFSREVLLPALERIFDEMSGEEEIIYLDHLFIDLGRFEEAILQGGKLNEALYDSIKAQVKESIARKLLADPRARKSIRESALAQWWYYMEHGRLSWNTGSLTDDWYRKVLEILSIDFSAVSDLRKTLQEKPAMLVRVSAQHNDRFLENLLAVMTSSGQDQLGDAIDQACRIDRLLEEKYRQLFSGRAQPALSAQDAPGQTLREALRQWAGHLTGFLHLPGASRKEYIWRRLLVEAAARPAEFAKKGGASILLDWTMDSPALMEVVLADKKFNNSGNPFIQLLRSHYESRKEKEANSGRQRGGAKGKAKRSMIPHPGKKGLPVIPEVESSPRPETGRKAEETESTDRRSGNKAPAVEATGDGDTIPPVIPPGKTAGEEEFLFRDEEVAEEGITISNAGVILLHPFFSTLFTRLKLWDGGGFADLYARQKAVYLLHFLATGRQEAPEHELVFPKMLCGYSLEMPVPGSMPLTEEECGEGMLLLDSALQRWEKLQNTSVEGLREGFLQRKGQLFRRNGRLYLEPESAGIDVLLDYLPWNLSLVKLPWLKELLYMEWR